MIPGFEGFTEPASGKLTFPEVFFNQVIPAINNLDELKLILLGIYHSSRCQAEFPYFMMSDIQTAIFKQRPLDFDNALSLALEHGLILVPQQPVQAPTGEIVPIGFINNPVGKEGLEALESGSFVINPESDHPDEIRERPNVFKLYQENIGIITPIIADELKELETVYPAAWIEESIRISVENNARSLRYIQAILRSWQEEGKNERTDRRRRKKTEEEFDPEGYTDGEYSDFLDF